MKVPILYLLVLVLYILFDQLWINLIAKGFIHRQIGFLLAESPNLSAGIFFYLIFAAGLLYFCVWPALNSQSWSLSLINGAFFGLVTYATYELVNKALLDKWPSTLVAVDILYGIFAGAAVSWLAYKIGSMLNL